MDKSTRFDLIFFTGAGVSVESGIPTFSEQPGLRDKLSRQFAMECTDAYRETIRAMKAVVDKAEPNAAHKAIAEMNVPVITMNIDGLHKKAGTAEVYEIHGTLPTEKEIVAANFGVLLNKPVLYGDPAPMYATAKQLVHRLKYSNSYFVIVGVSFYTMISEELLKIAKRRKARIVIINENATVNVPKFCEQYKREKI